MIIIAIIINSIPSAYPSSLSRQKKKKKNLCSWRSLISGFSYFLSTNPLKFGTKLMEAHANLS